MKKEVKKLLKDNSGAALVTVVVVITFISILATIILYTAGKNYDMKTMDNKITDSFYEGETAMEEVKAGLMVVAQEAFQEAYEECMINYVSFNNPGSRQERFNNLFVQKFDQKWQEKLNPYRDPSGSFAPDAAQSYIKTLVDSKYTSGISYSQKIKDDPNLGSAGAPDGMINISGDLGLYKIPERGIIRLGTVGVKYEKDFTTLGENGIYLTVIESEYIIKAPDIDWGDPTKTDSKEISLVNSVNYYNWIKK